MFLPKKYKGITKLRPSFQTAFQMVEGEMCLILTPHIPYVVL